MMWHPCAAMPRIQFLLALLCILGSAALVGCPGDGGTLVVDDDDTTVSTDDDDDDDTSEPPTPTVATPIGVDTEDGLELRGTFQAASGVTNGPAVLLLHELFGDRQDFNLVWDVFQSNGISTMAIDFRGHGTSPDAGVEVAALRTSPGLLEADVRAALDNLAARAVVDTSKIGILGLDVGANLAVLGLSESAQGSADPWGVDAIVAVTPDILGIEALGELSAADLDLRGAQYVAGEDTPADADDAQALYDLTQDPRDLRIVLGTSAHGAAMLTGSTDARQGVVAWFVAQFAE